MGQYVVFKSHQQLFALPVKVVKRVIEAEKFISLPEVPDYILGVYEYQEQMLPIVDLCKKLYHEFSPETMEAKVILAHWNERTMGIYVEEIVGITALDATDYEKGLDQAALGHAYITQFFKMADAVVIELNLDYLFNAEQSEKLLSSVDTIESIPEEEIMDDAAKN